jgi:hypothetical protein
MSDDQAHPMYQGEIENLSNRWLFERLNKLESDQIDMRILSECVKRAFGDYTSRMDLEDY